MAVSGDPADRDLAHSIATFIKEMPPTLVHTGPARMADTAFAPKAKDIDFNR